MSVPGKRERERERGVNIQHTKKGKRKATKDKQGAIHSTFCEWFFSYLARDCRRQTVRDNVRLIVADDVATIEIGRDEHF